MITGDVIYHGHHTIAFMHLLYLDPISTSSIFDTLEVSFVKPRSGCQIRSWKSSEGVKSKTICHYQDSCEHEPKHCQSQQLKSAGPVRPENIHIDNNPRVKRTLM